MLVSDLIIQLGIWDMAKLHSFFELFDINAITAIQIPVREKTDSLIWTLAASGRFSTKSAYLTQCSSSFLEVPGIAKADWKENLEQQIDSPSP